MSNTNTGGSAFPISGSQHIHTKCMTLRDYFAGQVAVGAMSQYWNSDLMKHPTFDNIAQEAYELADAMLKAREL